MREIRNWEAGVILNRTKRGESLGFHYSLNPYRGCSHACRYCYARESHTYLDLNVGEDFEQQLFVKTNLEERLGHELAEIDPDAVIAIGTVTDPYQPLEGRHQLTRKAISLLAESGHAFTITTKSPLIERDLDLLTSLGQRGQAAVHISLISLDPRRAHQLEPGASPPWRRLQIVRRLAHLNIPVGVFVAPIIPCLTDQREALDSLFAAIKEAGAHFVVSSTTRLSPAIQDYFIQEVGRFDPSAAAGIRSLYGHHSSVDQTYRRQLEHDLNQLYAHYGLARTGPPLRARPRQRQLTFALD